MREHRSGIVSVPFFDEDGAVIGFRRFGPEGPSGWVGESGALPPYGLANLAEPEFRSTCGLLIVQGEATALHAMDFVWSTYAPADESGFDFDVIACPEGCDWNDVWPSQYGLDEYAVPFALGRREFVDAVRASLPGAAAFAFFDSAGDVGAALVSFGPELARVVERAVRDALAA